MALESPYSSEREADRAAANYQGSRQQDGGGGDQQQGSGREGGGSKSPGGQSPLNGAIDAPREVKQGEAFAAVGALENPKQENVSGTIIFGVSDGQGKYFPLGRKQFSLQPGASSPKEFQVPRGATSEVPAGSRDFALIADSGRYSGVVAKTGVNVQQGEGGGQGRGRGGQGDGRGEGGSGRGSGSSKWGEAQHVQELPYGWHLYAQEHGSKDKTRYIIAAKNSNGEVIYLDKDGSVTNSPAYFTSAQEVQSALEAYAKRVENGNVPEENQPDPTQSRPSPGQVTQAANQQDGGVGSLLSPVLGPAGEGFGIPHIAALLVVGGVIWWLYRRRGRLSQRQAYWLYAFVIVALINHAWGVV
jgi:hypothetical protein